MNIIVTITTFLPLAGALLLLLHSFFWSSQGTLKESLDRHYRWIALVVTVLTFIASLAIVAEFNRGYAGPQLVDKAPWITSLGVSYFVGVDGISLWLVLLTTFLMPIAILASWHIEKRVREYMLFMLIL
ncbi:MAG: NADH-quinone oxidoreductase subunit M, partial [Blastocatellia bacterium]|nr:NADH-quinone oxidoreductase subunit M [Blastocatellia bacterium]